VAPLRRNRDYVALWIAQAVSMLGTSISSLAYPLVIFDATGSAAKAGLVTSTLTATTFVLRLPAGVLVDRWSRRRILLLCDAGRALAVASLAVTLALGHLVLVQSCSWRSSRRRSACSSGRPRLPPYAASSSRSRSARRSRATSRAAAARRAA
jgi:MFS family permease